MTQQEPQISIQDLELSLEVYEIESEQKLAKLEELFKQKGQIQIAKVFYEERSSLEIKFQNIISDLIQFLVRQQVATTQKLRKVFYRLLENPLLMIFKVSRFQIFNLRFDGFDIELEPIQAILELANSMKVNLEQYIKLSEEVGTVSSDVLGYVSYKHFLRQAALNCIRDKIFVLYSYLRKGNGILKKQFESKVKIVDIFNTIQEKVLKQLIKNNDWKTLKEISILNYEIYLLQNSYDVLCFYLRIPFKKGAQQVFKQAQNLAQKAKKNSNYDLFIFSFLRNYQPIFNKLKEQGISPQFYKYVENGLICLLQLWGCRLCHYQQFCKLFEMLLNIYTPSEDILEKCLKHAPKLQKDDIVLLRTNFKIQLQKKHPQLLMLLHQQTIEQTNNFLNETFHKKIYNLDFKSLSNDKIKNILTLLNGNQSLLEFFKVVQRSMKEWNYTIDFNNSYKFIAHEFKYPQLSEDKVEESIQLAKNLSVLSIKDFSQDFKTLLKGSTLTKFITQMVNFISNNPKCANLLNKIKTEQFFGDSIQFLVAQSSFGQKEVIYSLYSNLCLKIKEKSIKERIIKTILKSSLKNLEHISLAKLVEIFKNLGTQNIPELISKIMKQTYNVNEKIKKFRFIDETVSSLSKVNLSPSDVSFFEKQCLIKDSKIAVKNLSIFQISDLQLVTNPVQFQKIMDNYYFTLFNNSKKFVQFLTQLWTSSYDSFYSSCLYELVSKYPVSIPIIVSTRVRIKDSENQQTIRFIQFLCQQLGKKDRVQQILETIIKCQCIRYRNGLCYIKEEINPIIIKSLIKMLNNPQNISDAIIIEVLTLAIRKSNISNIKLDFISKIIQKTKFLIQNQQKAPIANKLSDCLYELIQFFLLKKQIQMRKSHFTDQLNKYLWNDVRQYTQTQAENIIKKLQSSPINDQSICSPFSLSQDFTNQELKLTKVFDEQIKTEQNIVNFMEIFDKIQKANIQGEASIKKINLEQRRQIDLTKLNYNLRHHLGYLQIANLQSKEKVKIIQKQQDRASFGITQSNDQNANLVKYYIKQLQYPIISQTLIIDNILHLITEGGKISYVWTNPRNLSAIFIKLIRLYSYTGSNKEFPKTEPNTIENKLISAIQQNRIKSMKNILYFFSQIGYTDLWGECPANFNEEDNLKILLPLEQNSTESFLSTLLKVSLQNQHLKSEVNLFLERIFKTRESGQNALIYKVQIDRHLLNLIMKSLEIDNLNELSFFIHSNFNNLRMYTDQLHEGLKALNIVSKNRSYNEYIQISKQYEDEEFLGPIKLFKQNFKFFLKIEKDGYTFKKNQEMKLTIQRLSKILRDQTQNIKIQEQVGQIIKDYIEEINKIQLNLANRIKSFYLVTKLRDLTYQNAITITILYSVLKEQQHKNSQTIIKQIQKVEIFSLLNMLFNDLILLDCQWTDIQHFRTYHTYDQQSLQKNITIPTTRRFSHSMSKLYEEVDLEMDQLMQRCLDAMKIFLVSTEGQIWIKKLQIYPPFLVRSFISTAGKSQEYISKIKHALESNINQTQSTNDTVIIVKDDLIKDILKGLRKVSNLHFYQRKILINNNGNIVPLQKFISQLLQKIIDSETIIKLADSNYLLFNKYKTSQLTLQYIQVLGYVVSYCIYHKIKTIINFHPSILAAFSFNIANLDDLYDVDFKSWQELRNVMNIADSKVLELNFSKNFQDIQTLQQTRIELVKQGSSKKVNNLNREQYADLVFCYLLYRNYDKQINRLLESICKRVPKQLISCMSFQQITNLFYEQKQSNEIMKKVMSKVGLIQPEIVWQNGNRITNLKDYQNINWLMECLFEQSQLQIRFWPFSTNIFVATTIGPKPSFSINQNFILIQHFDSKQNLKKALSEYK